MCWSHNPLHISHLKHMFKAGLFTAVITVSIVESYKWLSPDPGDQTVELLTQISGQLGQLVNNSISNQIPASSQPVKQKPYAVLVNLTWFCSMVICFSCSVAATLTQQCVRRYLVLAQGCGTPHERAHWRAFMFNGLKRFQVDRMLQFLAMALHVSIILYCVGLVGFVLSIDRNVGFIALGILAVSPLIYAFFTVLPIFSFDSPYATPFSPLMWRLFHAFLLVFFATIRGIEDLFHEPLSTLWYRDVRGSRGPAKWRGMLEKRVKTHRQRLLDGIRRTVQLCATEASQAVDANALEWTLTALVENNSDKEIENFAAWVPECFGTYSRSGAEEATLSLMSDQPPTNPVFGFRLRHLLKTCIPGTSDLTEEERKRRLRVSLKCLWYWVRTYNQNSVSLPSYFPLPSSDITRRLQAERDPTAHTIGRCFGALVAKKLAADVNSHHSSDVRVRVAKLASLSAILGSTSMEVETFLSQPGAIGLANIVSLTSSTLVTEKLPSEVLDLFRTTVDILLAEDFLTSLDAGLPQNLVDRFDETYSNARQLQAPDWLPVMDQLGRISVKLSVPVVSDAGRAGGDLLDHV